MKQYNQSTILVIDDDKDILDIIAFEIAESGFNVLKAINGTEAIQAIKSVKVDLIVSDVNMPKGDGEFILNWLGSLKSAVVPDIIFITGKPDFDSSKLLEKGARAVLRKPLDRHQLLDHINASVESMVAQGQKLRRA